MNEKDEKELRKREEKSPEEKSYEEKWRRDPLGSLIWALILIWAGVVWLASNLGFFEDRRIGIVDLPWELPFEPAAWTVFFLGAGVLVLIEVGIRLLMPAYRRPVLGSFIWAIVLFGIALGNWAIIWPVILIAIGASILLRGFFSKK
jgi:hypothetical protein